MTTANGVIEGVKETNGILTFKGVPFATPPTGDLRWKAPQPVKNWSGVKKCDHFGPQAMQARIYSDMIFRSAGVSEDCLYLNIWEPDGDAKDLPVLVYFYGGGYIAGDGSEPRYDCESMAKQGIIAITVNYRLGVFGFLAHPDLTKESPNHASGNYGLMDQCGGPGLGTPEYSCFWWRSLEGDDRRRVGWLLFRERADGLTPVEGLIAGAIGESGSLLGDKTKTLAEAEQNGVAFAHSCGASNIADLRAMTAEKVQDAAKTFSNYRFPVTVDGYFFPKPPVDIYQSGEQAHVPLLVGWNFQEGSYKSITGNDAPTRDSYEKGVRKMYGSTADDVLRLYAAAGDADVEELATELASDKFIAYSTWRWSDVQARTGGKPVYRYLFGDFHPATFPSEAKGTNEKEQGTTLRRSPARQPTHSAEIEYALGNLPLNKVYSWTPVDENISSTMQGYFVNFIKSGNPNGKSIRMAALPQVARGKARSTRDGYAYRCGDRSKSRAAPRPVFVLAESIKLSYA
ncbi:carboxylesterase/lipase family protein [Puia sp. P3]|uniref:carboxylesterase/lipase family protein n=1 Tax=Puia sp. P3 TaxID=3423952 RepID=UPI003D670F61